jgi:dihydrofolate synthase/folylpolyglutamate synthase
LPENELLDKAAKAGLRGLAFPEVNQTLLFVLQKADPGDLIIVCGSVYITGEINY